MDVGGSFLELACVRIAVIPAGPALSDHRFEELTSHLAAFREVPVNALPRRVAVPRPVSSASFSTVSGMSPAMRDALNEPKSFPLARSFSSVHDARRASRPPVFPSFANAGLPAEPDAPPSHPVAPQAESRSAPSLGSIAQVSKYTPPPPASPRFNSDLDLTRPDVDSSFRMRYEVIHRDHAGSLIMRPFSEWDDFHSTKVWGVFGIVDCTMATDAAGENSRAEIVANAAEDFRASLNYFKQAAVRRLIVFTHNDAEHNGPFVLNELVSSTDSAIPMPFSIGHVPERTKPEDTRLEARAQVIHFAGLLLNEIDRECWRRRESPASELFLSPIDENLTTDRQSKLAKRRAGRLDKLLGDSLLLMGSPADALLKYSSAMERSKASNDRLWLAGAMEGWSAAHVLAHVGSGASANDKTLTDKLISHYSDIYKLYQKKRVAEPEAAAAMRLAEFLSRWTTRRKEALDAAQHAATVGEGLRTAKRAALWEALARFSDRMGCRRKAAFYLYRLGQLNGTQSVLSPAMTLMIAAERQLCVDGRKPWPSLNRCLLLTAAKHAEDAGDSNAAAKLYVEALVTSPSTTEGLRVADEIILKSLEKAQIPAYLPAAFGVLVLEEISACHMEGLSIRQRELSADIDAAKAERSLREGPFIYNPFEAKKRAKEAEDAKRAVTWVCDETASICLRLVSNVNAESVIEVVAVLFSDTQKGGERMANVTSVACGSSDDRGTGDELIDCGWIGDEDVMVARHAEQVREAMKRSHELAHTARENVTMHGDDKAGSMKYISVVPRKTGHLFVEGVLVRLFNGALVILRCAQSKVGGVTQVPPVNVMPRLPKISVNARCVEGEYGDNVAGRNGVVVYDGEQLGLCVEIRNCGLEDIMWMKARVVSDDESTVEITRNELSGDDLLKGLERHDNVRTFRLQILGKWRRRIKDGAVKNSRKKTTNVSIVVEYEGASSLGTIRESTTSVRVACRPAVGVGRVTIFEKCGWMESNRKKDKSSLVEYCMGVEVTNSVSVPARVVVVGGEAGFSDNDTSDGKGVCSEECLVEHGACARLICDVSESVVQVLKQLICDRCDNEVRDGTDKAVASDFHVRWSLPAMGREGVVVVEMDQLRRAAGQLWSVGNTEKIGHLYDRVACRGVGVHVAMRIRMLQSTQRGAEESCRLNSSDKNTLNVGTFRSIVIEVDNNCQRDLPRGCLLDLELVHQNAGGVLSRLHRASLVGVTERVFVGGLSGKGGDKFEHEVKVRVASTGCFQIVGFLYDGDGDNGDGERSEESSNENVDVSSTNVKSGHVIKGVYESAGGKSSDDIQDVNVIYPRTMDSFLLGRSGRRRRCAPLAVSMLEISVVRDGARVC